MLKFEMTVWGLPVCRVKVCGPKAFQVQTGFPQFAVV
jgi:hypothetical protein